MTKPLYDQIFSPLAVTAAIGLLAVLSVVFLTVALRKKSEQVRRWDGTKEQFAAHGNVIQHWLRGGGVQVYTEGQWRAVCSPLFLTHRQYRARRYV